MVENSVEKNNQNIPGLVIISHGNFASELLNTAVMICGEIDNVVALGIEPGDDINLFKDRLDEILASFCAGTFVLVDIIFGTPFNLLMDIASEKKVYGIAGTNLPLLIELVHMRNNNTLEEISEIAEKIIHSSICNLNKLSLDITADNLE